MIQPILILAVLALAGCATSMEHVALDWSLIDVPEERRIELLYQNETGKTLCLSEDDWPNAAGKLNQMGDVVFLIVGSERFPIEDFNTGICPGGCERRVAPDEKIAGSIPYADFKLPERLWREPKRLEFQPQAYVCQ